MSLHIIITSTVFVHLSVVCRSKCRGVPSSLGVIRHHRWAGPETGGLSLWRAEEPTGIFTHNCFKVRPYIWHSRILFLPCCTVMLQFPFIGRERGRCLLWGHVEVNCCFSKPPLWVWGGELLLLVCKVTPSVHVCSYVCTVRGSVCSPCIHPSLFLWPMCDHLSDCHSIKCLLPQLETSWNLPYCRCNINKAMTFTEIAHSSMHLQYAHYSLSKCVWCLCTYCNCNCIVIARTNAYPFRFCLSNLKRCSDCSKETALFAWAVVCSEIRIPSQGVDSAHSYLP